jgi:hypothetical protein
MVRVVAVGYLNGERVEAAVEVVLGSSLAGTKVVFKFVEPITECRFERAFKDRN